MCYYLLISNLFELQVSPITMSQFVGKAGNLYCRIRAYAIPQHDQPNKLKKNKTYSIFVPPYSVQK